MPNDRSVLHHQPDTLYHLHRTTPTIQHSDRSARNLLLSDYVPRLDGARAWIETWRSHPRILTAPEITKARGDSTPPGQADVGRKYD